jgi:hypothetical protein
MIAALAARLIALQEDDYSPSIFVVVRGTALNVVPQVGAPRSIVASCDK